MTGCLSATNSTQRFIKRNDSLFEGVLHALSIDGLVSGPGIVGFGLWSGLRNLSARSQAASGRSED